MKVWGVIFLLCSISYAQAKLIDPEDEIHGNTVINLEEVHGGNRGASSSSSSSSPAAKERNVNFTASSPEEDVEEPPAFFLSADEEASPPGGGLPLDEKLLDTIVSIPDIPDIETPWWQHWWSVISGWFSGEKN